MPQQVPNVAVAVKAGSGTPQVEGVVTPSPTAVPGGKPLLTLYSISLQWADYDEAADTAAKAGWPAIGWTVRGGGHVLPENVARDLPKAVAAAKKAGLQVPIIITPIQDAEMQYAEAYLDTMSKLGLRYYQARHLDNTTTLRIFSHNLTSGSLALRRSKNSMRSTAQRRSTIPKAVPEISAAADGTSGLRSRISIRNTSGWTLASATAP